MENAVCIQEHKFYKTSCRTKDLLCFTLLGFYMQCSLHPASAYVFQVLYITLHFSYCDAVYKVKA